MKNWMDERFEQSDEAFHFMFSAFGFTHRKTETGIPMSYHSAAVYKVLKDYGCDETTCIAGILHDVAEDTPYTIKDLRKRFGDKVADIVDEVSENKDLEWEPRKENAVQTIKKASNEAKMVECADKINNLETLYSSYEIEGDNVFSHFKRGRDKQAWYYTEMFKSIGENVDLKKCLPLASMLDRYQKALELAQKTMFQQKDNERD